MRESFLSPAETLHTALEIRVQLGVENYKIFLVINMLYQKPIRDDLDSPGINKSRLLQQVILHSLAQSLPPSRPTTILSRTKLRENFE